MRVDFLGHSEFILQLEGADGDVRIMNDAWLSSHAFGDFLARNPVLPADTAEHLPPLDALFLSHPHCDHLDPYTLVPLFKRQRPVLLLPENIAFLRPVFDEYLDRPDTIVLRHDERESFRGLSLRGLNFIQAYHTNEDDVMCLAISGKSEFAFFEGDTGIPDTEEAWGSLYTLAADRRFKTRLYVSIRNELEALYLAYDSVDSSIRRQQMQKYRRRRNQEIRNDFEKFIDSGVPDFWALPGLVRILIGQGMILPAELNSDVLRLSAPFTLAEVAGQERKAAAATGKGLSVQPHRPGFFAEIEDGRMSAEGKLSYVIEMTSHPVSYEPDLVLNRVPLSRPLRDERRSREHQESLIMELLNHRYRPALAADLEDPLKKIIREAPGQVYAIEVKYGTASDHVSVCYGISFEDLAFTVLSEGRLSATVPSESYWANDLEDHLLGAQDMFSTTLHTFEEGRSIRLWTWLGLPLLNSDIIVNKLALHFERAARGETVADWVIPVASDNLRFG